MNDAGRYRKAIVVEEGTPPESLPPQGVELRGNGWKVNVPMVVLTGILSAFGARMMPAQNAVEADTRQEARLEALRNAERWEEQRAVNRASQERLGRMEDEIKNLRMELARAREK